MNESVYVFQKGKLENDKQYQIDKKVFVESVMGVWKIPPVKKIHKCKEGIKNTAGHPCPFPIELPYRLLKLYSYPGDLVLDPFGGIGSTSLAARLAGRNSICVDISVQYCNKAYEILKEQTDHVSLVDLR